MGHTLVEAMKQWLVQNGLSDDLADSIASRMTGKLLDRFMAEIYLANNAAFWAEKAEQARMRGQDT